MNSVLVLGLIPGTNIQIAFTGWVAIMTILIGGGLIYRIERNARKQTGKTALRVPFHASQLHQRV